MEVLGRSKRLDDQRDERVPLRELSEEELKTILEAHQVWVSSEGKEGAGASLFETNLQKVDLAQSNLQGADLFEADLQRADLPYSDLRNARLQGANMREANLRQANLEGAQLGGANLQMADLIEANLNGANLFEANLQKAGLSGADLRGAHLYKANLRGADLRGAKLQGAELAKATLREADLQDANLEHAKSFLGEQLAGANVSGTKLPEDIREFKVLQVVEETSKNARKVFLATLLGCAYAWLTVASTTDAALLANSPSQLLPNLSTPIQTAWFYVATPFILLGLYVYLHFYLHRLWQGLAGLPARFPDGKRLDERAHPWLLNGLVRRHFTLLKEGRAPIAVFEEWVTIFLAWWTVPATLFGFWLRYLPLHEWWGTGLHIGLMVVSVALAVIFYRSAARTLRGGESQPFHWRAPWRDRRAYQSSVIVLVGVVLSVLSYGAINGVPSGKPNFTDVRTWAPWTFERLGYSTFADLRETDISTKPANYWQLSPEDRIKSVRGASLRGRNLRYANAVRAFLVNAGLREANLQGAYLGEAKLQAADLQRANLQNADLRDANLQGADLRLANLQGVDLWRAKLQRAVLRGANLQGANLSFADLNGATLDFANLQGAKLGGANLEGADLRFAKGLTQEQLDVACGDAETKLPDYLSDYKMNPCPEASK